MKTRLANATVTGILYVNTTEKVRILPTVDEDITERLNPLVHLLISIMIV